MNKDNIMTRGPCAKRRVICHIMTAEGPTFSGENDCANPQAACPRLPGEDYTKCQTVCQQSGHAEIEALRRVQASVYDAEGSVALLEGHYWICEPCGRALRDAGVRMIKIAPSK